MSIIFVIISVGVIARAMYVVFMGEGRDHWYKDESLFPPHDIIDEWHDEP